MTEVNNACIFFNRSKCFTFESLYAHRIVLCVAI